jgi:uncharacterized membrane protein YeaQ/YmgE (transglycosylase-associated protein family)
MGIIVFLLFGLLVGLVARLLMPGRDPMGLLATMALGCAGSLLGFWFGRVLGLYHSTERIQSAGFVMSLIGAVVVLLIGRALMGRRRRLV